MVDEPRAADVLARFCARHHACGILGMMDGADLPRDADGRVAHIKWLCMDRYSAGPLVEVSCMVCGHTVGTRVPHGAVGVDARNVSGAAAVLLLQSDMWVLEYPDHSPALAVTVGG